jgi:hypothetical protein
MRSTLLALVLTASPAAAQLPNYLPNYYNRQTQPLSPYLNLLRGTGNPGVNYYYGVRPGLPTGGLNTFGQVPPVQQPVGPQFGGFLPQSQIPYDPAGQTYEPGGQPVRLNSPSHPVVFGNQYPAHGGFSSVYAQNVSRTGFVGQRPAQSVAGLGTVNRGRAAAPMPPAGR